jgi:hypothetical protein
LNKPSNNLNNYRFLNDHGAIKVIYLVLHATSMHNTTKLTFIILVAIVASMVFVPRVIMLAQAQMNMAAPKGTLITSGAPMSGMNMSAMVTSQIPLEAGAYNPSNVRDSVALFLEGSTIPAKGFIHLYDAAPYMIHNAHVGLHVPCDTSSKNVVDLLAGQVNGVFKAIQPANIKELSEPGQICFSYGEINSDMAKKIYITDIAIQNPSNQAIKLPPTSMSIIAIDGLIPLSSLP